MRFLTKYSFLFISVLLLDACKPAVYFKTDNTSIPIDNSKASSTQIDSLIQPYKVKLDAEMNEVLVISTEEFPKEKGKSETKLGNLVADLSMDIAKRMYKYEGNDSIDFCLLNFGGLRTSLPKGEITRGKIFEIMPFDNELVVITISQEKYYEFIKYINNVGGQPVGGDILFQHKDVHPIQYNGLVLKYPETITILTSDYLANGGDNMNFFLNPIKIKPVGIKLRDAIIQYCMEQHKKGKQLVGKIDGRMKLE